ncbi:MAG: PPC domain-containing protein [Verrucomicrobia bacterium]|nr:PPC domain-containing protein [Verrucomicrobiota bacterium]
MKSTFRPLLCLLGLLLGTVQAMAYSPDLNLIEPRGAQRGTELTITLHGERIYQPEELLFYKPGITVKSLELDGDEFKAVRAVINIAPEAELGEHPIRLRCKGGVTSMRTLWVGQFPTVMEAESNNEFTAPQEIPFNTTVQGIADKEDADYYRVQCRKGQRLSVEVEGMRLGRILFDPYVAILNAERFELASADDIPLLRRDCAASIVVPEDGAYTVLIRESSYEGRAECQYRAHIGEFPRPLAIYPPGAKPGEQRGFRFIGDASGDFETSFTMPAETGDFIALAAANNLLSPSGIPVRVSDMPSFDETEPNEGAKAAVPAEAAQTPIAFHGILSKKEDKDWFRFKATKGQKLRVQVFARSLRSPLDSVIIVRSAKDGKALGSNDDTGAGEPDSRLDLDVPEDGDYLVNIRDQLHRSGPDYTYRIEIAPRSPALSASLPYAERNQSQLHKMISVPRGNRTMRVFNINRQNIGCNVEFSAPLLPDGVQVDVDPALRSVTSFPVVFEANGEASLSGGLYALQIRDPESGLTGPVEEAIHHIEVNNAGTFHSTLGNRHAVAVIEEAPFHLDLEVPPVPLVRNGTMLLRIIATRNEGYKNKIKVTLPWKPPGVGAPASVDIPEGRNEVTMQINSNAEAPIGDWRIAVDGEAGTDKGSVLLSSRLLPLKVAEPYVAMTIEMAATETNKNTEMICKLEHFKPFEGNAKVTLIGLPHGVTSTELTFVKDQPEVIFPLQLTEEAKVGKHANIFAQVIITENGHPVPHSVGAGGTLRIDPPPPAPKKPEEPKPTPAPEETPKEEAPKKPLSRLEQLRQAQQK